jgi:hypothetical protein
MELVSDPWDCSTDDSLAPGLSVSCENSTDLSQRHTLSRATKNIPSMREAARATKRVPCTKSSVVVSPSRVRLGRSSWLFFDSVISSIVRCGRLSLGWGKGRICCRARYDGVNSGGLSKRRAAVGYVLQHLGMQFRRSRHRDNKYAIAHHACTCRHSLCSCCCLSSSEVLKSCRLSEALCHHFRTS